MFDIEKTTEYKGIKELEVMDSFAVQAINSFAACTQQAYNMFWFAEVSPEIKIELLGTKALEVFTKSAQAQAFIKSIVPNHIELGIPEGYSISWNEDGSGTITYTPPIIENPVVEENPPQI